MAHYQYEGKHFQLPDGLSNEEAIAKIKTHLGQSTTAPSASIPGAEQYDAAQAAEQTRKVKRTPGEITSEAAAKQGKSLLGGLEALYGVGHNVSAYLTAFPYSAVSIAAKKLPPSQWADELMSNVEQMSYVPKTDKGGEYLQDIGVALQPFGLSPYANVGQVGARGAAVGRRTPKVLKEVPVSPVTKSLDAIDADLTKQVETITNPGEAAFSNITDSQLAGWNEPVRPQVGSNNGIDTVLQQTNAMRQTEAQRALEARQTALEADVKRQTILDMNAAERARQERAPTGFAEAQEALRRDAETRRPGDSTPMDFESPYPARIEDYPAIMQDAPYQYKGGIDVPFDTSPLENHISQWNRPKARPEEMVRFEDEGNTPITPQMPKRVAEESPMSTWEGEGGGRGLSQRGAINMAIFDNTFERVKDLANGIKLIFKGSEDGGFQVKAQDSKGRVLGETTFGVDDFANPQAKSNLEAMAVDVNTSARRSGLASEMYKFASEIGNDIVPGRVQTPDGKALWKGLERKGIAVNGMIRNQRGGIDFKAITEEVNKINAGIERLGKKVISGLTPKEAQVAKTINDNSFVPKGSKPEDIIAKALTEQDGPSLFTQFQSGLQQAGEKANSTVMRETARWLNWGEKVGDKYFRQNVKPVERTLSMLPKADLEVLMLDVMKREMFNRKQYTPDQLAQAGLSADSIKAYIQLRGQFANALKVQNEARALLGKKPITPEGAYFASMWNGNYHMPVYDKQGKLVWYVKTETAAEARAAAQWFKANHAADFDVAKLKPEYRPQNQANFIPRDAYAAYEYMLDVFKDTPMAKEIQGLMEQAQANTAFTRNAHDVHFERKANIHGFAGDRPWLTRRENAIAAAQAQVQYLKDAYHWAPLQEAMLNIKEVLTNPELVNNQPNNINMAKLYTAQVMGVGKNLFKDVEGVAARVTGVSPSSLNKFVGSLKTLTYLSQLGMSAGYIIATPLQALIIGPGQHLKLSNQGIKHNVLKSAANALSDSAAIFAVHQADAFGLDKRNVLSPLGKRALRYMEDNGIIDVSLFDEYAQLGTHKGVDMLKSTIGMTIQLPEKLARSMTFMSFVHHLKDSGMPEAQVFRRAEEITNTTLTNFKKSARPLAVEQAGLVGELAYTYKSPMFNYFNTVFEFGQDAKRTGKYGPLASILLMPALLGGMFAMPLMEELDGGVNLLKEAVAKWMPEHYSKVKGVSVKEAAMKHLPNYVLNGAVGEATGAQMTSRFSTQAVDLEDPAGGLFPVGSQIEALGSAAKLFVSPSESNVATAIYKNLPPVLKGLYETNDPTFKAGVQGDKQLYYTPSKLSQRDVNIARTEEDETYRKFGLTSTEEARTKDARFLGNKETMRRQDVQKALLEKTVDAIITKNFQGSQKFIEEYAKNGGTSAALTAAVNRGLQDSKLTPEQRELLRGRTLIMIEGALRKREMTTQ